MSVSYRMINWDRQKKIYDLILAELLAGSIGAFAAATVAIRPGVTAETLIIRSSAVAALALLHVILAIGPLSRLDRRFLPLLYNRRHLGVTMFFLAFIHAGLAIFQFHAFSDRNPLVSVFTAYATDYTLSFGIAHFPFEPFGAAALVILFLMAATSHDFWLKNLGASWWKSLHLLVYFAYGCVLAHVFLGVLQSETSGFYPAVLGLGFIALMSLHLIAWRKERRIDMAGGTAAAVDGFVDACAVEDLREGRGHVCSVVGERVALWRRGGRLFATSNVCRHQGGPVGEGRIVDGCATCPWHGWNYRPEDGMSPPPFHEVLPTYRVRVAEGRVYVHPDALPLETKSEGAPV